MIKWIIVFTLLVLVALMPIVILSFNKTPPHSYKAFTMAVYNGTHIQDYFVECDNGIEMNRTAVSEAIHVGQDWKDPREKVPSCERE
jgi:hypothetical protein